MATLHELDSPDALESFRINNANALVCFSATWCGPCSASKPQLEDLARSYESDPTIALKVGIVYEHNLGDALQRYQVRAFPTYILYVQNGAKEFERIEGVNFEGIKQIVKSAGCKMEMGTGYSLGGTSTGSDNATSAADARMKRLEKFQINSVTNNNGPEEVKEMKDEEMKDAACSAPEQSPDVEMEVTPDPGDDNKSSDLGKTENDDDVTMDVTANLSAEMIETLTQTMGFSMIRAQKGLLNGGGEIEGAVEWIMQHQDDNDIDDPICTIPGANASQGIIKAQSYKCNECGKVLSNMANLELHANKTGHSDFEESTQSVKPLTAEEKAAKILEIKSLLKAKRDEREESEKQENIDREKQRRFMGKEMTKTREEMEREQRKREALMRKKEKEAFKRERERIRKELEKDKMERMAHKGKLNSKLGIDGYHPDGIQYDVSNTNDKQDAPVEKPKVKVSSEKIDEYIAKVSSYKAGGDGGKCLKVLKLFLKNVVEYPNEPKYKSINTDGKAYKQRVKPFLGAKSILLAVGFKIKESGDGLVLADDADLDFIGKIKTKLEDALSKY